MIGIGIDTGGTCTDAVVYDTVDHKVLSASKTLTTKQDLKKGIIKALEGLDIEKVRQAKYISLSTTLATNACVENKGGRAKLIFIGVNPKVVERMKGTYGLPPIEDIFFLEGDPERGDDLGGTPNWEKFRADVKHQLKNFDSVAVVQINPKFNDGIYEKTAEDIIKEETGLACVRGYDLYQEINVQKRGATALLNARLLTVINDFFKSIEESLKKMDINLPIVIVKSDGSVMTKDFAAKRPVETLLSGPAASVIGAMELSRSRDALIVDMGGTTSDIALSKNGVPVIADAGIRVGRWKTMVKGISIDTFALGGDSGAKYKNGILYLDDRRIIPLCMLAEEFPEIIPRLRAIAYRHKAYSYPAHEFFRLVNKPENEDIYTKNEKKIIKALERGPLSFEEAAAAAGVNPFVFKMKRLEDEGIIIRAGVTPTDVMHIRGDYTDYNVDASILGVEYLSFATGESSEDVCEEIYSLAKSRLYSNLVRIFLKHETGEELSESEEMALQKMTRYVFLNRNKQKEDFFVEPKFHTSSTLIGIGAPTRIFLRDVAELFNTKGDFPNYGKIANAIGAAVGNISAEYSIKIEPDMKRNMGYDFNVMAGEEVHGYNNYDDALAKAKKIAREKAILGAKEQGAKGEIKVKINLDEDFYKVNKYESAIFVQTVVTAKAVSTLV